MHAFVKRVLIVTNCKNFHWIYLHTFFIGKLLVATGFPLNNGKHIEVIDILNPNSICEPKQNYPLEVYGATGSLIKNDIPLICGGWDGTNNIVFQCYIIGLYSKKILICSTYSHTYTASKKSFTTCICME